MLRLPIQQLTEHELHVAEQVKIELIVVRQGAIEKFGQLTQLNGNGIKAILNLLGTANIPAGDKGVALIISANIEVDRLLIVADIDREPKISGMIIAQSLEYFFGQHL